MVPANLTSALYVRGDPYETSDAVFGVKESLIVDLERISEASGFSETYGVSETTKLLKYDFVLVSEAEGCGMKGQQSRL
jgi:hypothetical protein